MAASDEALHFDEASAEATASFLMRLRRSGVRDLDVLRAIEETPRLLFAPRLYRDLAFRDLHLPLPCGQSMPDAFFVAWLAEAARLRRDHRLLEVGAGSGFATAVLARLCAEVVSLERYRTLRTEAQARLAELQLSNAYVEWADGDAPDASWRRFDRIVAHAALNADQRARFLAMLEPGGSLLCGEAEEAGAAYVVVARLTAPMRPGEPANREALGRARLRALEPGLAQAL